MLKLCRLGLCSMATQLVSKLITTRALTALLSRSFSSVSLVAHHARPSSSLCLLLRPLAAASVGRLSTLLAPSGRGLATRATSSSLNDPNPNWSNRPPKETILLDGCDFNHWLVVMEPPEGNPTRDEIIDSYIKTLAMVVGSEEEARMKIYSVSTRCYFAFGALVPEELSLKIKELPRVRWVLPDSYLDVKNKDYGGEPFINGQAVPYDPKYHEEWIRNNARANERNRRNDRPRNFDRSRNFERRRENMQNRDFQNQGIQNPTLNSGMPPSNNVPAPNNMPLPNNMPPPNNMGGMLQNNYGGMPTNHYGEMLPPNNHRGQTPNYGGFPPNSGMEGMPPNAGWSSNQPGNMQRNTGGPGYQTAPNTQFQKSYNANKNRGNPGGNPCQD